MTRVQTILSCLGLLLWGVGCSAEGEPGTVVAAQAESRIESPDHIWPPEIGKAYPNLQLRNSLGERVSLESFKGRVILVEPIGMDCPACNAFAGGNRAGATGFDGIRPQASLPDVEEMLREYGGGISLDDERLVIVHLLLYKPGRKGPPSVELGRRWAKHFGLVGKENMIVLIGEEYLIGKASYAMIPGFHLIDRDFVFRYDAAGHHPRHDVWRELMPALPGLLAEVSPSISSGG